MSDVPRAQSGESERWTCGESRRIDAGLAVRGYGYASRDNVEIHLGVVPDADHRTSSAYLFVADADELAAQGRSVGVDVGPPEDTEWGQREGAAVDPDGNSFGSVHPSDSSACQRRRRGGRW